MSFEVDFDICEMAKSFTILAGSNFLVLLFIIALMIVSMSSFSSGFRSV